MTRRAFHPDLRLGRVELGAAEAHHVRDVMRAGVGDALELFDAAGRVGDARIAALGRDGVGVEVSAVRDRDAARGRVVVASAVPKADRADWLVEKLGELGVDRWAPLRTARSVVHPEGDAKLDRWRRIGVEAAKQSRRAGVMTIDPLVALDALAFGDARAFVLSTRAGVAPLSAVAARGGNVQASGDVLLLVGPEGGWTDAELDALVRRGAAEASLTDTVLRIETAAVVAAGIIAATRGITP